MCQLHRHDLNSNPVSDARWSRPSTTSTTPDRTRDQTTTNSNYTHAHGAPARRDIRSVGEIVLRSKRTADRLNELAATATTLDLSELFALNHRSSGCQHSISDPSSELSEDARNVVLAMTTLRRAQAHCPNTGLLTRCTQAESHRGGIARGTSDERSALLSFRLKIVRGSAIFARPDDAVCITSMSRQREVNRQLVRPSGGRQLGPRFRGCQGRCGKVKCARLSRIREWRAMF